MIVGRPAKLVAVAAALLSALACAKAKKSLTAALHGDDEPPYAAPPGAEATQFLAPSGGVAPANPSALSAALDLAAADAGTAAALDDGDAELLDDGAGSAGTASTATVNFLKQGAGAKEGIATTAFSLPSPASLKPAVGQSALGLGLSEFDTASTPQVADPTAFNPKTPPDTVSLDPAKWANKTELLISRLGNIPVRDQGERGTCAAHAGVGLLEYTILKKYASKLSTVSLSPQRFYMISKKDHWNDGGKIDTDGGSAWGNGYETSFGMGGTTVPSVDVKYNIPLEADCPYNAKNVGNELQLPMPLSCERGSVRVTSLTQTFYSQAAGDASAPKTWYSSAPLTAQQIFDRLQASDLPVPVAANLSQNFLNNDGMITQAASVGQPPQGGHAFLIVGARKIDEAKFPNEGGMCFVAKNSWGLGWGINGFSCMTLAWWNNHRETTPSDLAFDVDVDMAHVLSQAGLSVPAGVSKLLDAGTEPVPVSPVTLAATPNNPGLAEQATADTAAPAASVPVVPPPAPVPAAPAPAAPAPATPATPATPTAPAVAPATPQAPAPAIGAPGVTADGFTVVGLVTPAGGMVKAVYKADLTAATLTVKGILADQTELTSPVTLGYAPASGELTFTDPHKGAKVVGTLTDHQLTLCAQQYAEVCRLNLVQPGNQLVVGLTLGEWDNYPADANADYTSLVAFGGYGIDAALAGGTYVDVRLKLGGQATNPLRFKVDPVGGAITYKGREIGNYQKAQLCSGADYKLICRFVVNGDTKALNVFFKATK